ncbi:hypothetical protein LCGC14_2353660, partial [marine sediment metagenome]
MNTSTKKLIGLYEKVLHGDNATFGVFDHYDHYYKGSWDEDLKKMGPIVIQFPYNVNYLHSYGQDSPWFAALSNGQLIGTKCKKCSFTTANPKLACQECGEETKWIKLPKIGNLHAFTVCHFGAEAFLDQTPFILGYMEFKGCDTLLLTRILGL